MATQALGNQVKSLKVLNVGGVSRRAFIEGLLPSGLELDPVAKALVAGLDKPGDERQESIVILPTNILHVRSSGHGAHYNPFHPEFPGEWTTSYLGPQYLVSHLGLNEWADAADKLDPELLKPLLVRNMVDLWCGTRWLRSANGEKAVLFKLRQEGGRMVLTKEVRDARGLDVAGFVAFSVCQLGDPA